MTACFQYYYYVITTTTALLLSLLLENLTSRSRKAIGSNHGDDRLFTTGLAYTARGRCMWVWVCECVCVGVGVCVKGGYPV